MECCGTMKNISILPHFLFFILPHGQLNYYSKRQNYICNFKGYVYIEILSIDIYEYTGCPEKVPTNVRGW